MSLPEDGQAPRTDGDDRLTDEVQFQSAVLRYCETVLRERARTGERAWLWRIKGKIATYCRRSLERDRIETTETPRSLTPPEAENVLRTHPLLNEDVKSLSIPERQATWMKELRARVRGLAKRLPHGAAR